MLKLFILHVIHRIASAGLCKMEMRKLSSLAIRYSTGVWKFSPMLRDQGLIPTLGCGRFFEGTPEEMHTALNKTLAALPDDTKVYVSGAVTNSNDLC